ncbi:MAG: hypothetical protein ACLGSD_17385 [Acidobacteriota bacterium]
MAEDSHTGPVHGLTPDDLSMRIDNLPVSLRALGTDANVPIHISLLIDVSLSQKGMETVYAEALRGLNAELHPGRDFVNIYTFGSAVRLFRDWQDVSSLNVSSLQHIDSKSGKVLQKNPFYRIGGTRLFDAVSDAIENDKGISGRKAILILSDGVDEGSDTDSGAALKNAERGDVSISALEFAPSGPTFISPGFFATKAHDSLAAISKGSGGVFLHAAHGRESQQIQDIIRLLKEEYILYFPLPQISPGPHRISIVLTKVAGSASLRFRQRLWIASSDPESERSTARKTPN